MCTWICFLTIATAKWSLTFWIGWIKDWFLDFYRSCLSKFFITMRAGQWFFSSMNPLMNFGVWSFSKFFLTIVTASWFWIWRIRDRFPVVRLRFQLLIKGFGLFLMTFKGQLISKCLFGIFNSPKKRTKKFEFTNMVPQVELFLGELKTHKKDISKLK